MDIILASRNKKKIEELKSIIEACGFSGKDAAVNIYTTEVFPQCEEVEEDGATFEANAVKKAAYIFECSGMTAVADDSGLEVDALDGAPGVFSARYAGEVTDDWANLKKLLREMEGVPDEKRGARFVCCIALATSSGIKTFMGHVEGRIGREPRGEKGFGYDPVFYPEGHDRTFAEMGDDEKASMSHRGRALRELQGYLKKQGMIG
ncbi:MAG: XTP/dITP diphosphatase [Nitrospiraceae bacterium]|nr:MAG: XTP/dITP diphosphatase [Nitrospiraceae bacterium]